MLNNYGMYKTLKTQSDVTQTIDTLQQVKDPNNVNYYVHAETDSNNVRYSRSGVQNFISDYVINKGNSVNVAFGNIIRNIQANLMYRCAGFIDHTNYKLNRSI